MSDHQAPSGAEPTMDDQAVLQPSMTAGPGVPPSSATGRAGQRSRTPVHVALLVVAVLSSAAMFVSGFTLGAQQAITPGTSAQNQQLFEPFWDAWNKVTTEYVGEYDRKLLLEGAIQGIFVALDDPYSAYMTSEEYRRTLSSISGQFEGIGAEMTTRDEADEPCQPISETCRLAVVHVLRGSPALAAGLKEGDIVVAVDGQSVLGSDLEKTVDKVRGPAGTSVTLGLERDGRPLELAIERAVIQTEDVTSQVLAGGQVGYLKIDGFSSSASTDFVEQLQGLVRDQGLKRIVLDLRDDPGGFVNAAQEIASQFVSEGPIFWEEDAAGHQDAKMALPGGVATDDSIALVLLVNGGSASASEIVAGALADTDRAILVGEKTFGKGTIQEWHPLDDGEAGGFRLSVAKWLTPNKTWIHGKGITPDVVVPLPADTPDGQDPQLDRAIEILTSETGTLLRLAA